MPIPKWLVVARNEYRLQTAGIREVRPYFPYLALGLLAVYVAFVAPKLVGLFIDDIVALLLSRVAVALVQIVMFMVFVYLIIIPVTQTLKEVQAGQLELIIAAPVRASEVLLGEFVGRMPFYAIAIALFSGLFTAVLRPLGLDLVQMAIINLVFVLTFVSAYWIGVVISALLRTRLGKTARGKDIGKALGFVIALPLIGVMYALIGGGLLEALADPTANGAIKAVLSLLPSSWGAEIVVLFVSSPGNIGAVGLEAMTRFGGLVAFLAAVFWVGARTADRVFSLEPTTFTAASVGPDGAFYRVVKALGGGGSFGTLLVSVFKDYSRRLENISKIVYIMGLVALISIFLVKPEDVGDVVAIFQMVGPILAGFVASEATLRGKESLFIYRKTPSGVGRFVRAKLVQSWLVVVPLTAAIAAISMTLIPQFSATSVLAGTGYVAVVAAANVAFVLGLFLLNPAFSEKAGSFILNLQLVVFCSIGLWLGLQIGLRRVFPAIGKGTVALYSQMLHIALIWLIGVVFLYLGKRKLSRLE